MAALTTRSGKGSALSNAEMDANLVALNGATFIDRGAFASGTVTLDATAYEHQRVESTGNITIALSNVPASGKLMELLVEAVNFGGRTITWPTVNWVKSDGTTTTTTSANGVTWQTSGTDFVLLWTRDGGTTIYGKVMR